MYAHTTITFQGELHFITTFGIGRMSVKLEIIFFFSPATIANCLLEHKKKLSESVNSMLMSLISENTIGKEIKSNGKIKLSNTINGCVNNRCVKWTTISDSMCSHFWFYADSYYNVNNICFRNYFVNVKIIRIWLTHFMYEGSCNVP